MSDRNFRFEADAFMVWREGKPVGWQCTVADLAEATGLSKSRVRYVCKLKGWPLESVTREAAYRGYATHHVTAPVDRYITAA